MSASAHPRISVVQGDITKVAADAIVNATNEELRAGAGVCGAIFRAAGIEPLEQACAEIGHCPTGSAVITPAFGIKTAKHIVHAVGPVYASHSPDEARKLLRSAYAAAIKVAAENGCKTIAFPAIGTGIYGYPRHEASREAVDVCTRHAAEADMKVILVAFDAATAELLRSFAE
jgi:O-acetyl-ADP-ribose deacetylase